MGGLVAAVTLRVADRAVSLRLTEAQVAGQMGASLQAGQGCRGMADSRVEEMP